VQEAQKKIASPLKITDNKDGAGSEEMAKKINFEGNKQMDVETLEDMNSIDRLLNPCCDRLCQK
jgi:hypothetical protein